MLLRKYLKNNRFTATLFTLSACTLGIGVGLGAIAASAHNVEVKGNVAITFHIEPNHSPKVGMPSQAWFLLTRKGGNVIPLSQCDCQLAVFALPAQANAPALFQPILKAIAAEKYAGIPGADISFAKAGLYELKLSGKPKLGSDFQPFSVSYRVTVTP